MHKDDIARQIEKYKSRRRKTKLAHYSAFVSIFLLLSIFADGITARDFFPFLITLPLPLYFGFESLKLARKSKLLKQKLANVQTQLINSSRFSLISFLTQPSLPFRLTLILFLLVIFTTFARTSHPDASITYQTDYQQTVR